MHIARYAFLLCNLNTFVTLISVKCILFFMSRYDSQNVQNTSVFTNNFHVSLSGAQLFTYQSYIAITMSIRFTQCTPFCFFVCNYDVLAT